MQNFSSICFTHKSVGIEAIGRLHIDEAEWEERLGRVKAALDLNELLFISTCNRVEFYIHHSTPVVSKRLKQFFAVLYPHWSDAEISRTVEQAQTFEGIRAVKHLFKVASSLDSLVIGEREIISQVRASFEKCAGRGLTGDFLRLLIRKTVETAKAVFTETEIANRPVSVVNLAYRQLINSGTDEDTRFLMVGAGKTNAAMARHLHKHGFRNFFIFNRTLSKAQNLAAEVGGKAYPLGKLPAFREGFDVLISCTGSTVTMVDKSLYQQLLNGEKEKKLAIDLAVPADLDQSIAGLNCRLVSIEYLKEIAEKNLEARGNELEKCMAIVKRKLAEFEGMYEERKVEIAMRSVPGKVKEIRKRAVEDVFAKDLENLDDSAREVVTKFADYFEKKYMGIPMKMAREILLNKAS